MNSRIALLLLPLSSSLAAPTGLGAVSPPWDWGKATPESEGIIARELESMWSDLEARKTTALIVIRDDKIVFERYSTDNSPTTKHYSASMAKALVVGVSVALTLSDGLVSLDDLASKYISQWADEPTKSNITIRQLGSHTAGLADAEEGNLPHEKLTGWKGDFWKRLPPPNDPFSISRDKAPMLCAPGSRFQYSNPGMAMLGYAITAACRDTAQRDLRGLLRDRVMRPIGVPDNEWSIGYGQTFDVGGLPMVATWGGGNFTPRAVARVGRLMLRKGNWEGKQLLSARAVEQVTSDAGTPGNGGIGWWSNNERVVLKLPDDAFWGAGAGHQVLLVVPSLKLIAVRNGDSLSSSLSFDAALREYFFAPLMRTLDSRAAPRADVAPYPPSPVIQGIGWAPKETIVRKAKGSDNWPLTRADDDGLYTSYGDGNGFEPFLPEKLSLGLARISGSPAEFKAVNVRSVSLEQKGEGKDGKKASGILMVDGVLYLWARNAGNSQLAWSTDHGGTWTWSDWKFAASFGCPTFLNFGKNYAGARDDFVYVYSHDSSSAYEPADRFVLARVAKDRVRTRQAYQFLDQLDAEGQPIWTRDINGRGAVFAHPNRCYRSGITYNSGLKRYLWCQTLPGGDARFRGGFGIYDAPEPWGPWTTVFHTNEWDVGPGETSSFPTKWMGADGKTVHLVFSGEDSFSVRKASLILRPITTNTNAGVGSIERPENYFPPPESQGGWRKLDSPEDIRRVASMDPAKLDALKAWLLRSDDRNFAAVVIRRGHIVLEVERGNSSKTDSRRVASVSKAICATVLAIASEQSQQGLTPKKMKFDDPAFGFIPWAEPLSDPRKERITVKQLLNHTSGLCPEATGAPNDGTWEYIMGHSRDDRTAKLAFDPGAGCGYSTHALAHAALVCETVTGKPYDRFAMQALFEPLAIEHWWFQYYEGAEKYGRHPSHGVGMPARDLARIAYCMLRGGRWNNQQVIPKWFVEETAAPTHDVKTPEMRWKLNPQIFSHGWELPARLTGEGGRSGDGIPPDARDKPGSGGQLIAFVPSLDLVVARQTGSSGEWQYEEYLRRACAACEP